MESVLGDVVLEPNVPVLAPDDPVSFFMPSSLIAGPAVLPGAPLTPAPDFVVGGVVVLVPVPVAVSVA